MQVNEPLRFRIRQRPQQDRVNDTKDRGIRADPERQSDDRDRGEGGLLEKRSQRETEISKQQTHVGDCRANRRTARAAG